MMAPTGTHSSALVLTLLTFCPPGPPLRANWKRIADSGARTPGASSTPSGAGGTEGRGCSSRDCSGSAGIAGGHPAGQGPRSRPAGVFAPELSAGSVDGRLTGPRAGRRVASLDDVFDTSCAE